MAATLAAIEAPQQTSTSSPAEEEPPAASRTPDPATIASLAAAVKG